MQRLLVWHSGDKHRLQSQGSGVQIQVSAKKIITGGVRSRDRVRGVSKVRDRHKVRAGGECIILFEKNPPPPPPPQKSGTVT